MAAIEAKRIAPIGRELRCDPALGASQTASATEWLASPTGPANRGAASFNMQVDQRRILARLRATAKCNDFDRRDTAG